MPRFADEEIPLPCLPGVTGLAVSGTGVYCFSFQYLSNVSQGWEGFPGGSDSKESACSAGDLGSIPGLGRDPGEGNGIPLQHSRLENPMDGGAWWATVHGVAKSQTQLSDFTFTIIYLCNLNFKKHIYTQRKP